MSDKRIDEATGVHTVGHEWDGIEELDNPLPRWWVWAFYLTIAFAIGYVVVYPAIPLLHRGTEGLWGWTSRGQLAREMSTAERARAPLMARLAAVPIEKLPEDPALLEASSDLYANKATAFTKVVLPLSMPGVFAAVLLTFVPVAADYVNATILGGPKTTMIGNIIQTEYFTNSDYPTAAALSFILMAALLIGVFAYAKALGTDDVLEMAAA